jgi:Protein of unknown function (DUF2939)
MLKSIVAIGMLLGLTAAYAVWPLLSAFEIKQAIHSGDVATLERKVHWAPVRASLKASIALLPADALSTIENTNPGAYGVARPSLWTRIKAATEPLLADRFVDAYITPQGIAKLQKTRDSKVLKLLGLPPPEPQDLAHAPEAGALQRFLSFYAKVVHARFQSLSEVEIETADHRDSPRHVVSQFVLSNFDWKLASVRIVPSAR